MHQEILAEAIARKIVIAFTFKGERCTAEPCAVGIGHDGHSTFTAYQTSGPTEFPDFPWIYRRTATLVDLEVTNVHFLPKDEHCHRDSRFQKVVRAVRMVDEPDKINNQYRYQPGLRQGTG